MKDRINSNQKYFELNQYNETERKFLPVDARQLAAFRESSLPIEQYYLSFPNEPFSLRMREFVTGGELAYEATIKDRGELSTGGLSRLEVTAPITAELYGFYKTKQTPMVRKLRAEPMPGVTIDYYEDGSVQVESEDEQQWSRFTELHSDAFIEITGDPAGDNERRAYEAAGYDTESAGRPEDTGIDAVVWQAISEINLKSTPIVHIGGRSGSGKSTVVGELTTQLEALGFTSALLSTDDYHRGASWLARHNGGEPWQCWDDRIVYDITAVAHDLDRLRRGEAVPRRAIDWVAVEPMYDDVVVPADVIIVEGIYALDREIASKSAIVHELKTPLATCVGRRLLRDLTERPEFADPVKNLSYMLTEAEPAYRRQNRVA